MKMTATAQLANRFREIVLNGDWVAGTNFKVQLTGTNWEMATTKTGSLNSIAALVFHVDYYIAGILNVLEGGSLDIRDRYSFDLPPVTAQEEWEKLLHKFWNDSEKFAIAVEQLPDKKLNDVFVEAKYGSYQRNIDAMIEHCYYHLGQIVLIKKMLAESGKDK